VQISAGNPRKVSDVQFEQINNGEAILETKEITRLFPGL